MKLLLDTHIWFWSVTEPEKLSARVVRELGNRENELWLSPITIWELGVLDSKGRLSLTPDFPTWVRRALRLAPFNEAIITSEIAMATRTLSLPHRDPADRLLAATAKVEALTLVTQDDRLLATDEFSTLPNK